MGRAIPARWAESPDDSGRAEPGILSIGDLSREFGISLRALRHYQTCGLLIPSRQGAIRQYTAQDRERLALILQGKRLGFTLAEIRELLEVHAKGGAGASLRLTREQCIEQIKLLERQRRDLDDAIAELRRIYSSMFAASTNMPHLAHNVPLTPKAVRRTP